MTEFEESSRYLSASPSRYIFDEEFTLNNKADACFVLINSSVFIGGCLLNRIPR